MVKMNFPFNSREKIFLISAILCGIRMNSLNVVTAKSETINIVDPETNEIIQVNNQERDDLELYFLGYDKKVGHYTIMDRNLGATEVYNKSLDNDTVNTGSFGYHYQFGNNYGFAPCNTTSFDDSCDTFPNGEATVDTQVPHDKWSPYMPSSYANNKWNNSGDGCRMGGAENESNIRGGAGDSVEENGNSELLYRQGPCPDGYYVPSVHDWNKIKENWRKAHRKNVWDEGFNLNPSLIAPKYSSDFLMPFVGYRTRLEGSSINRQGEEGFYLLSSYYTDGSAIYTYVMSFVRDSGIGFYEGLGANYGGNIRCVKMLPNSKELTIHANGGISAVIAFTGTVGNGRFTALGVPSKRMPEGQESEEVFLGWYSDPNFTHPVEVGDIVPSDIYAKWQEMNGVVKMSGNITYTDTNGKVFTGIGTISITSGNKTITILDRNLGATESDFDNIYSHGYYFQWGNNYGFGWTYTEDEDDPNNWEYQGLENEPITEDIDISGKLRNNPYVNSGFFGGNSSIININDNLWGGSGDSINGGLNVNSDYKRQGPCPAGFHVPSVKERKDLLNIYKNLNNFTDVDFREGEYGGYFADENTEFVRAVQDAFNLPIAGMMGEWQYFDSPEMMYGIYLWTSSPAWWEDERGVIEQLFWGLDMYLYNGREFGLNNGFPFVEGSPIRCFADNYEEGSEPLILLYDTRGGSAIQSQTIPAGETGYLPGYTTHRENHTLLGWYDSLKKLDLADNDSTLTNLIMSENMADNGNLTIYAKWDDDYAVLFVDDDGTPLKAVLVRDGETGQTVVAPDVSDRELYEFVGWDKDFSNITEDITVTAQYKPRLYTITYELDGGVNNSNNVTGYTVETPTITLKDATKDGYNFKGWFSDAGFTIGITSIPQGTTGNLILYAKWEKKNTNNNSGSSGGGGGGGGGQDDEPEETEDPGNNSSSSEHEDDDGECDEDEGICAYEYSYEKHVTTMPTIEDADMEGYLDRIAMAKMLSYYAINELGKVPDVTRYNKFNDVPDELDDEYNNGVNLAYQLGIMGINMSNNEFRPFDLVTRAEFVTALSRLLYEMGDGEYEGTEFFYKNHMEKLYNEGIITNTDPFMLEVRGYVMRMLYRSAK